MTEPAEILQSGSKLLEPLLLKHGFRFKLLQTGSSSGGRYASGEFAKGTRKLELHFRYSLGLVSYHLADRFIGHQQFMESVIGRSAASHYPGFSSDPLDAFRDLLLDLQEHGAEFLSGTDSALLSRFDHALALPQKKPNLPK